MVDHTTSMHLHFILHTTRLSTNRLPTNPYILVAYLLIAYLTRLPD